MSLRNVLKPKMKHTSMAKSSPGLHEATDSTVSLSDGNKKKQKLRTRRGNRRGRADTNTFFANINVGMTVRLAKDRIGFVRYKGKVRFSIGTWYGVELYDSLTKTRHNGTVYGKRYFTAPRRKGLFIKREVISGVIKPHDLKAALKELENKQIEREKKEENERQLRAQVEQQLKQQQEQQQQNPVQHAPHHHMQHMHHPHQNSILALYQSQVYGNDKLVHLENHEQQSTSSDSMEKRIKKDFKRFQRLSFMAANNKELQHIMELDNQVNASEDSDVEDGGDDDGGDDDGDDIDSDETKQDTDTETDASTNTDDVDIDEEAWDSKKEQELLEILDEADDDENGSAFKMRLFYPLKEYITDFEHVLNKGLLIKAVDSESKQGRAFILECGIQGNDGWYIQTINEENIKKFSKEAVQEIVDKLVPMFGYEISLVHA